MNTLAKKGGKPCNSFEDYLIQVKQIMQICLKIGGPSSKSKNF